MRKFVQSSLMLAALALGGWAMSDDVAYRSVGSDEANGVRGAACYTSPGYTVYCFFSCGYYIGSSIGTSPGPYDLYNTACSSKAGCVLATYSAGACTGT